MPLRNCLEVGEAVVVAPRELLERPGVVHLRVVERHLVHRAVAVEADALEELGVGVLDEGGHREERAVLLDADRERRERRHAGVAEGVEASEARRRVSSSALR